MRRYTGLLVAALVVLSAGAVATAGVVGAQSGDGPVDCSFPVSVTDATGTEVTVPAEPDRVVALGPSAAQTMWDIGAREKVVGMPMNAYTAYLEDRGNRTDVYTKALRPDVEATVGAAPDLVLVPNVVSNDTVEKLRSVADDEFAVYRFREARTLEDVAAKTELTGRLVGEFEAAATTAATLRGQVAAIRDAVGDRPPRRVYFALGGGWTAGTGTFLDELLTTAGGRNIAAAANISSYAQVSQELLISRNPEWIVLSGPIPRPSGPAINGTEAIQADQVRRVDANLVSQAGPRVVQPLAAMAGAFHPGATEGLDLANVQTPVPRTCSAEGVKTATTSPNPQPVTEPPTPITDRPTTDGEAGPTPGASTTTSSQGGPGFGPLAGLLALAGVALLAGVRRRA